MAAVVIYAFYDPTLPWFPRCLFKQATGLDCPGCGSQRALHALLTGHFADALRYNLMVFILAPLALLLALIEFMPARWPRLYRALHHSRFIQFLALVIIAWWIFRNLSLYPY